LLLAILGKHIKSHMQTKRLKLVLQTLEEARAEVEAMSPADKAHVSADWLARLRALNSADPWTLGFFLVHRDRETVVGSAGFTGPPTADGAVEISYGVNPDHQGNGYATEAAQALTAYAFSSGKVRVVRAHTRPDSNASTGVLVKCGFRRIGEVIDPEDGLVWRWEKHQEEAAVPAAPAGGA
jgi:RimJ/RimL family protein N-acetyltransferase